MKEEGDSLPVENPVPDDPMFERINTGLTAMRAQASMDLNRRFHLIQAEICANEERVKQNTLADISGMGWFTTE